MKKIASCISVMAASMMLSACIYPLGMTEAEWNRLSPDQQYEARVKQAELDEAARVRRAQEREHKQEMERERAKHEASRVHKQYREARYGDILQCIIRKPTVDFHPGWRRAETLSFSIVRTEVQKHVVRSLDGRRTTNVWMKLEDDGRTLRICRRAPEKRSLRYCDTMTGLSADYMTGVRHTLDLPDLMQGVVECAYGPGKDGPKRVILYRD